MINTPENQKLVQQTIVSVTLATNTDLYLVRRRDPSWGDIFHLTLPLNLTVFWWDGNPRLFNRNQSRLIFILHLSSYLESQWLDKGGWSRFKRMTSIKGKWKLFRGRYLECANFFFEPKFKHGYCWHNKGVLNSGLYLYQKEACAELSPADFLRNRKTLTYLLSCM